ncbi:MAG: hypothetical protein N838_24855 [Thiohalocapsa sp. PB-PSB1]|nr:MAG: hypothetical protein N838_24855 [Thiohalocapsa sp. PB-PSB1]
MGRLEFAHRRVMLEIFTRCVVTSRKAHKKGRMQRLFASPDELWIFRK